MGSKTASPFTGWRGSYSPNNRREGGRSARQRWATSRSRQPYCSLGRDHEPARQVKPRDCCNRFSAGIPRWRDEASKFSLHKCGKCDGCAVFEVSADDLDADRQPDFRTIDRRRCCGKAGRRSNPWPDQLIEIRILFPVDLNMSCIIRCRMVVGEGRRRHWRAEHDVPFTKQFSPLLLEPGACCVGCHPVAMAQDRATCAFGDQGFIIRIERLGRGLRLLVLIQRPSRRENR